MNTVEQMQSTLDEHKEALPTGAYVQLYNGLKQLHSVTKLYIVKYCEVTLEDPGDGDGQISRTTRQVASCVPASTPGWTGIQSSSSTRCRPTSRA